MTNRESLEKTEGIIFEVQRWSLHDGDGIRSTIFMKGCPLRCKWCHNPESWQIKPEILFFSEKCTGCGKCSQICPTGAASQSGDKASFDRPKCTMCLECLSSCQGKALKLYGNKTTAGELFRKIKRDSVFYRESGGGVTLSGGEPTMQPKLLDAIVRLCSSAGIDTAIETSAYFEWDKLKDTIELIDFVFVDLKHMDNQVHKELTGAPNCGILKNIVKLSDMKKKPVIRIPLIEGVNDGDNLRSTLDFISKNVDAAGVELLPYHSFGESKYPALGLEYSCPFKPPSAKALQAGRELIKSFGLNVIDYK